MGKQSQLLLKPTEVELGLQVGVEFDNNNNINKYNHNNSNGSIKTCQFNFYWLQLNNYKNDNHNNNYYNKTASIYFEGSPK